MKEKKSDVGLIIFSKKTDQLPIEKINLRILEEIKKQDLKPKIFYYDHFSVFFKKNKLEIFYDNNKINPKKFSFFITQYYFLNQEFSNNMFIVNCLNELGIKVFNSISSANKAKNKRDTLLKLSMNGLPIIPTSINFSGFFLDQHLKRNNNNKIVVKSNNGSMGYGVSVLDSHISFVSFMEFVTNKFQAVDILIQPFVESNNEDYRVFVVGNRIVAGMKRRANGIEFRANVSKGGLGIKFKVSKKMAGIAIRATKILGLDYAGVDIIKDKKGDLMIVEVNSNPGLKIENATGINIAGEIIKHCIKKSKK